MFKLTDATIDIIKKDLGDAMRQLGQRIGQHESLFGQLVKAMEAFDARLEVLEKQNQDEKPTEEK